MFDLSIEKILVLLLVALFVLGPERLPAAAAWLGKSIRQAKGAIAGANAQLRAEMGPELDQLRAPLAELRAPLAELRALRDPRAAVMRHLLADPAPATSPGPAAASTAAPAAVERAADLPVAPARTASLIDTEAT